MSKLLAGVAGQGATATLHSRDGFGDETGAPARTSGETRHLAATSSGRRSSNARHQG